MYIIISLNQGDGKYSVLLQLQHKANYVAYKADSEAGISAFLF